MSEEKARKKKCKVRFLLKKKEQSLPKELHESGCQEDAENGYGTSKDLGVHAVGMAPTERLKLRRQMAAAASRQKEYDFCPYSWKHTALK